MAQTKVSLIKDNVIVVGHLHTNHGITTGHIGEGSNLYFTDARVMTSLGSVSTHIIPDTNIAYDLGSPTNRFRDLYLSSNTIHLGTDTKITVNNDGEVEFKDSSDAPKRLKVRELDFVDDQGRNKRFKIDATSGRLATFDAVGTLTADKLDLSAMSTADLAEGSNLYYTDARVGTYLTTNSYATQVYVNQKISDLVASAPTTLDTLNELAAALGDDPNFATTVSGQIGTKWTQDNVKIANWDTAYGWGDHSAAGYLTSFDITSQTDSKYLRSDANDSTTGELTVESGIIRTRNNSGDIASIRFSEDTANDHVILEYDGTGTGATNYFHMYSNVSGWATKGSSFNLQPSTGDVNIGGTNFGYKFRVDGSTYLGGALTAADNIAFSGRLLKDSNSASDTINIRSGSSGQYFRLIDGEGGIGIADSQWSHTLQLANFGSNNGSYSKIWNNAGLTIQIGDATNHKVNLTGQLEVGTFSQSQTNSGEAWIGRAADRVAGTLTVQLGTGTGRKFEVVDYNWSTVEFEVNDSGTAFAAGDFRAPLFYDSNNTSYYLNPASTSSLNQVVANNYLVNGSYDGNFGFTGMSWGGSTNYPTLFSSHSDRWVMHIKPHVVWTQNGQRGYTGSTQGSLMRFEGDLASSKTWDIGCLTSIASGGDYFGVVRNSGAATWAFYADPSCNLHANTSMRAPIFYDSNNTTYYSDPDSTSNLNALTVNGTFTVVNGVINMNNNDGFVYDDGNNVMKVKYDGTEYPIWTSANDGSGSGLDADTVDGYQAGELYRRTSATNATVGGGWMTVAACQSSRYSGEIYVTDGESGDHAFIRIHWMRSYQDSNFTVLNCGGHANRITGARVLYQTSDNTYGWKYLQVYVTTSSNYYVRVHQTGDTPNFSTVAAVTPVIENSKSGYAVHGNELTDLDTYGFAAEEGIRAGGPIKAGGDSILNTLSIGGVAATPSGYAFSTLGAMNIYNQEINYVGQLHFNDNVRFYDDGNDNYLNFKAGNTGTTGIKFYNGNDQLHGYVYGDGAGGNFGLLSADGSWGFRCTNSLTYAYHDFYAGSSSRAPIFYDSDSTSYYVDPASGSQFSKIYYNEWIRNNRTISSGLYWESGSPGYGWHLYPVNQNDFRFRTGSTNGGIVGTINDETARGYVHWTTSNEIGFLNSSRSWSLRVDNSGNTFATTSHRAPIFYDSDDTAYYLNAASTSRLNQTTTNYVNVAANSAYALRFWNGSSSYKIGMSTSGDTTNGGRVAGETTSDYNMYFTMSSGTNRGFVFRSGNSSSNCVAGIDAGGNARFIGSVHTPFIDIDKTSTYGPGMDLTFSGSNSTGILIRNNTNTTTQAISFFYSSAPQGARGSITVSSTSTAYNTSSDYRLKENLVEITDGIERVKLLQPKRFNFIGDDKTVDGFVAHEAQEVVPEAVTGVKDGVDYEGNPEYQGIDQAKLVPLLTAALQEAIAKIESLEARIQVLENQ